MGPFRLVGKSPDLLFEVGDFFLLGGQELFEVGAFLLWLPTSRSSIGDFLLLLLNSLLVKPTDSVDQPSVAVVKTPWWTISGCVC